MEALSRREEEEIETAAKNEALKKCDEKVRAFAECATGRTFTVPFACASQYKALNDCLKLEVNEERLDELKLEYIANRSEKGRQAVDALIAERRLKLLKLAGKKDEASVLQAEIEARKRAA
ncbi:uncharacterized protein EHS24_004006 [Apiotrichum porosum]|uniref:COX assembly mitochondrial protein n=1 Tax=Apiotrichum porosum TaxID=105984 RepID=A0A427Y408_9TREE|nr:uncharacterized protein EHS24_004006 [Apiotrichum porosum]RSH85826.1 hypothetical protein EHS24_004006 [Apiotrichum porosum]